MTDIDALIESLQQTEFSTIHRVDGLDALDHYLETISDSVDELTRKVNNGAGVIDRVNGEHHHPHTSTTPPNDHTPTDDHNTASAATDDEDTATIDDPVNAAAKQVLAQARELLAVISDKKDPRVRIKRDREGRGSQMSAVERPRPEWHQPDEHLAAAAKSNENCDTQEESKSRFTQDDLRVALEALVTQGVTINLHQEWGATATKAQPTAPTSTPVHTLPSIDFPTPAHPQGPSTAPPKKPPRTYTGPPKPPRTYETDSLKVQLPSQLSRSTGDLGPLSSTSLSPPLTPGTDNDGVEPRPKGLKYKLSFILKKAPKKSRTRNIHIGYPTEFRRLDSATDSDPGDAHDPADTTETLLQHEHRTRLEHEDNTGQDNKGLEHYEDDTGQDNQGLEHDEDDTGQDNQGLEHDEDNTGQGNQGLKHDEGNTGQDNQGLEHDEDDTGVDNQGLEHDEERHDDGDITGAINDEKDLEEEKWSSENSGVGQSNVDESK